MEIMGKKAYNKMNPANHPKNRNYNFFFIQSGMQLLIFFGKQGRSLKIRV
jgi:hypothetical protein